MRGGFVTSVIFCWCKPELGLGNYYRNATELLLLGVRGPLRFARRDQRNWSVAPRTEHSTKPDRFRAMIESVSPGPYLEIFARRATPGWTVIGDQVQRIVVLKRWYLVCPRCAAKGFSVKRKVACPRCGKVIVGRERLVPPWGGKETLYREG